MEISPISQEYIQAVKDIKSAILKSRYAAAKQVNKELLKLYYSVGGYVSTHSRDGYWGSNAIETISMGLQQELPGLRGFSPRNIKNMRTLYEQWSPYLNRQMLSDDLNKETINGMFERGCVKSQVCHSFHFNTTKPRLSQARALFYPNFFVTLDIVT